MMKNKSRRNFLLTGAAGTAGVAALGILPTLASGEGAGDYGAYVKETPSEAAKRLKKKWSATEDNILGPFHRKGAPYRSKVTPPLVEGETVLIRGQVWGFDTKKPLAAAVLDVWQASHKGRYDNDDPNNPPGDNSFAYRSRIITDENGFYEYETILPGKYKIGPNRWRPAHIHYWIAADGYKSLITQLYFEGDAHNKKDPWIKKSLTIALDKAKSPSGAKYKVGKFDIVLAPGKSG